MLPTVRRRVSPLWADFDFDLDRFFGDRWARPMTAWSAWTPSADMYETDEGFGVALELPGYTNEDINISVERGFLTISGQKTLSEEEEGRTYHLRECGEARFTRSFTLPSAVNADAVTAELRNGVLLVTLPKMEEARPRKIEVSIK